MNQISINTVPVLPMRIPKKEVEISWLSDANTKGKSSLGSKNVRLDKDFKNR